jgi:predicted amidohydrolase
VEPVPRLLPLAVAQVSPVPLTGSRLDFADQVTALMDDFPNTRLAIYPELHLFGVDGLLAERNAALRAAAEPLDGPRVKLLGELAGDLGVWLMPGTVCELGENGALYNTAVVLSPTGELVASYRKCFPWRPYEPYLPGDRFVVFDLPVGRIGVSICYDAWFPEVARHLAWMGAGVIVNPTRTTTCDRDQEVVLARANAITNQVFVISVNAAAPLGTGRSVVVDPEGRVRVGAAEAPTVLTDVLDLDDVTRVRTFGTAGLNRMWDQFRDADEPLELPLYQGRMDPKRWRPTSSG